MVCILRCGDKTVMKWLRIDTINSFANTGIEEKAPYKQSFITGLVIERITEHGESKRRIAAPYYAAQIDKPFATFASS